MLLQTMTYVLKTIIPEFQNVKHNLFCDIFPLARQTRMPFLDNTSNANVAFELLNTDVWGPFKTPTMTEANYFLTIVDDCSRSTWTQQVRSE